MRARISEAIRLTSPLVRSTVTVLDVVSRSAGRAATRLSDDAADQGAMLVPERPVSRLEPSDRLLTRHFVHNVWRVQ